MIQMDNTNNPKEDLMDTLAKLPISCVFRGVNLELLPGGAMRVFGKEVADIKEAAQVVTH